MEDRRRFRGTATLIAGQTQYEATHEGKPGDGIADVARDAVNRLLDEQLPPNDFDEITVRIIPSG